MTSTIELKVGSTLYSGWQSLKVRRSLQATAGTFTLGVTVNNEDSPLIMKPGAACSLELNSQRVITGYIDQVASDINATSRTITLTGRDKTGDLIDCAAIHGNGQWRKATLQTIANDLCQPFGVKVVWNVNIPEAAEPFKVWQIQPGETVFSTLLRASRHRNVLMTSNPNGDLVFLTVNRSRVSAELVLGKTSAKQQKIKQLYTSLAWNKRFSVYHIKGDNAAGGKVGDTQTAAQSSGIKVDVPDAAITRYRPTIVLAEDNITPAMGKELGEWEKRRAMAAGTTATATVVGWLNPNGELWQSNQLVTLEAKAAGIEKETLLITETDFSLDRAGGTVTTLTLMPPEGFGND